MKGLEKSMWQYIYGIEHVFSGNLKKSLFWKCSIQEVHEKGGVYAGPWMMHKKLGNKEFDFIGRECLN